MKKIRWIIIVIGVMLCILLLLRLSTLSVIKSNLLEGRYKAEYDISDYYVELMRSYIEINDCWDPIYREMYLTLNDDGTYVMETDYDQLRDNIWNWLKDYDDELLLGMTEVVSIEQATQIAESQNMTYEEYKAEFMKEYKKGFDYGFEQNIDAGKALWDGSGCYTYDEKEVELRDTDARKIIGTIDGTDITIYSADFRPIVYKKIP
ncbi:hypothetical protein SAMN02910370_02868 [Lachnospiraceae bacterium XPB1003]|nr:hypothetical protein SAMN02910370_02868 [Lachnospiraceae bacterium XPB1003]